MADRGDVAPILIVEDEPAVREVLELMLVHEGYATISTRSGAEALMHTGPFALAIVDVMLPVAGGVEVYTSLAERQPGLPAVFISGHAANGLGLPSGPHIRALQKPFTPLALAEVVHELVR